MLPTVDRTVYPLQSEALSVRCYPVRGGRTHLLSPAMAAAAALTGHLTDVRALMGETV